MNELTPAAIVATFAKLAKEIEEKALEIDHLDAEFTAYKVNYQTAFAKAFLSATGAENQKRYTAVDATDAELWDMEVTEQKLRAAKEALKVLRDRLEIGRSMSAIMRMEWSNNV